VPKHAGPKRGWCKARNFVTSRKGAFFLAKSIHFAHFAHDLNYLNAPPPKRVWWKVMMSRAGWRGRRNFRISSFVLHSFPKNIFRFDDRSYPQEWLRWLGIMSRITRAALMTARERLQPSRRS
jgi:hypothetical protein